jgi:hypothetical protein
MDQLQLKFPLRNECWEIYATDDPQFCLDLQVELQDYVPDDMTFKQCFSNFCTSLRTKKYSVAKKKKQ